MALCGKVPFHTPAYHTRRSGNCSLANSCTSQQCLPSSRRSVILRDAVTGFSGVESATLVVERPPVLEPATSRLTSQQQLTTEDLLQDQDVQQLVDKVTGKVGFKSGVVICGGGPAGLAAAMVLAKRGWTDITVVERRQDLMVEEPDRSYVYMVDGRGHKLLSQFKGLGEAIDRYAVPLDGIDLTTVQPDGKAVTRQLNIKSSGWVSRWLPRTALIKMMHNEGLIPGVTQGWGAAIRLATGTQVASLEREARESGGWQLKVTLEESSTGKQEVLRPHLVVGADGLNSLVRTTLMSWEQEDKSAGAAVTHTTAATTGGNSSSAGSRPRFELQQYDSPSANLRYKVLNLPPNPVLTQDGAQHLNNPCMGVVLGKKGLPAARQVRLGLLPVRDSSAARTANIILPSSGHELMEVKDAEQLYTYLEDVFPQVPVRQLIPPKEAARFAASKGGRFPHPQHVNGLQMSSTPTATGRANGNGYSNGSSLGQGYGVVLLGDSRAAFPPDIGQGVNSAFEDVIEFEKALDAAGDDVAAALPRYEASRLPDIRALVQLMTFAYPWQYSQDMWNKGLWTINFLVRMVFNKVAPKWFSPQAFLLVQDYTLSYSQVLQKAHETTRRLVAVALVAVVLPLMAVTWSTFAPVVMAAVA